MTLGVLILAPSFHPTIGGAESYAFTVAAGLAELGHRVTVVTDAPRHGQGTDRGEAVSGDPVSVDVQRLRGYLDLVADPSKIRWEQLAYGLLPELGDVVAACQPDVTLTNSLDTAVLGRLIATERGIPWVCTAHEHAPQAEPFGGARLDVVHRLLDPAVVLAGSEFYADRARAYGDPDRVEVITHGVDTDRFSPSVDGTPARRRYGCEDGDLLAVCAGRLKERKGIREALEGFCAVASDEPRLRLVVAGTTSSASIDYARDCERLAASPRAGGRARIDTHVSYAAMPELLAAADVVVQPSHEEALGLAVLEAMASRTAVITSPVCGVSEILTAPDLAELAKPGDGAAVATALRRLVDDPDRRELLAANGRSHVCESFSLERMITRTEQALLRVVGARRDARSAVCR